MILKLGMYFMEAEKSHEILLSDDNVLKINVLKILKKLMLLIE